MKPLSDGRFSSTGSPIQPHDYGRAINDKVDPIANLLKDCNSGILVASRRIEFLTRVVEGARDCRLCQDPESICRKFKLEISFNFIKQTKMRYTLPRSDSVIVDF